MESKEAIAGNWWVRIIIRDLVDADWSDWLGGLSINYDKDGSTILEGNLIDSSAFFGLITQLRDWSLELLAVNGKKKTAEKNGKECQV